PRRSRGCAAPLRRPDRLPLAAGGRRSWAARAVRLRRRRAHRRPGRACGGTTCLRRHARARRRCAGGGRPPEELDAAIIFAPAGELVPAALAAVAKGGTVVCAGIHMSDIPSFPYELLWGERVLRSV